jgi:serpin B
LLPPQGVSVGDFVQRLTHDEYARVCLRDGGMKASDGDLHLPRFKIECSFALNDALKALGMPSAFDENLLPFTEVCNDPCYISDVLHKTYVECNEEGTEAAAVTAVMMRRVAVILPVERFSMRCDRPFLFAISAHKALLFVGIVDASVAQ